MGKIYNVSAELSLTDFLAERFLNEYKSSPERLSEILFLMPSQRACRNLKEAFVRQNGRLPTILPQIKAICDTQDDEIYLSNNKDLLFKVDPEVSPVYRTLVFTKMIMQTPDKWGLGNISTAQAYALAENLSSLIDLTYENDLSFENIKNIVCEEYAEHWQEILKLLSLITFHWPNILREKKCIDKTKRSIDLLREQLKIWKNTPPPNKIIVAGTTAGFPVIKELVKTVSELDKGEVYLYGLDTYLSESSWEKIDENHPQFELKELLDYLQKKRHDIIPVDDFKITAKQRLISEIMRPASTTSQWQKIINNKFNQSDFDYLKLINCDDMRQEAFTIALIMREVLETPEKTVALVTTDRNLSRRVVSELKRWNILADDSSGKPLHLSPIGIYFRLIINVLEQNFSKISLLALLKHPFTKCAMSPDKYKIMIYHIERKWRNDKTAQPLNEEEENLLSYIYTTLKTLNDIYFSPFLNFAQMFEEHLKVAEKLADTDLKTGDKIIWRKEDGICMAEFVAKFYDQCSILGNIPSNDYSKLFTMLLSSQTIRSRFGQHPRVKILGPIEARLQDFDVTIIGEANEGKWPQPPQADMWMSRPMKREFGMPVPERSIGIAAADFAHLLAGKKVYITRAEKDDGAPTGKSRWLLRLETVMAANYADTPPKELKNAYSFIYDAKYAKWARDLERADIRQIAENKILPPSPKPPVYARPRKMSAGKFSDWLNDPYTIYARYILQLYPLDRLDKPCQASDYGNLIHDILLEFNSKYPCAYPPKQQAITELHEISQRIMIERKIPPETIAFWKPAISSAIDWIVQQEENHRRNIDVIYNEISGKTDYTSSVGKFIIEARADRLEKNIDGSLSVIDYKTGSTPGEKAVIQGYAPQLPIEALIAQNDGFPNIKANQINTMSYWKIGEKVIELNKEKSKQSIENAFSKIKNLIEDFDNEDTPYYSHPTPVRGSANKDYEHLSRYLEWSVKDTSENLNEED